MYFSCHAVALELLIVDLEVVYLLYYYILLLSHFGQTQMKLYHDLSHKPKSTCVIHWHLLFCK